MQTVLNEGARHIVVQGLPPVGCFPVSISLSQAQQLDQMGCNSIVNTAIDLHNKLLQKMIERFRRQYPQSTIIYANYWKAFLTIFNSPGNYNFKETKKACCGGGGGEFNFDKNKMCGTSGASTCSNPDNYISWDGIHLSGAMNKQLADLLLNQGYCEPPFSELMNKKTSTGMQK